jgi:hypothetical protein
MTTKEPGRKHIFIRETPCVKRSLKFRKPFTDAQNTRVKKRKPKDLEKSG